MAALLVRHRIKRYAIYRSWMIVDNRDVDSAVERLHDAARHPTERQSDD